MSDLIQGENATFYVAIMDGSTPLSVGVSGTTIDIYHFNGGFINDVSSGAMTQQNSPFNNIWYYNYNIPNNADVTTYNIVYNSLFSGNVIQATETFNVLPAASVFPTPIGGGTISVSGSVIDASGTGIVGASVVVTSGNNTYGAASTSVSGLFTVMLNAGQYLFSYFANGYFPNSSLQSIPSGTTWNIGPIVLQLDNQGAITISDTFVYQTPELQIIPLPNLKVTLTPQDSITGDPPAAVAYTDMSGTWVMNANAGLYVLAVQGEYWNPTTSKNDRYNYTYNIEVNPVWSGTGISGTSSPFNFQYLDTSKYNYIG